MKKIFIVVMAFVLCGAAMAPYIAASNSEPFPDVGTAPGTDAPSVTSDTLDSDPAVTTSPFTETEKDTGIMSDIGDIMTDVKDEVSDKVEDITDSGKTGRITAIIIAVILIAVILAVIFIVTLGKDRKYRS